MSRSVTPAVVDRRGSPGESGSLRCSGCTRLPRQSPPGGRVGDRRVALPGHRVQYRRPRGPVSLCFHRWHLVDRPGRPATYPPWIRMASPSGLDGPRPMSFPRGDDGPLHIAHGDSHYRSVLANALRTALPGRLRGADGSRGLPCPPCSVNAIRPPRSGTLNGRAASTQRRHSPPARSRLRRRDWHGGRGASPPRPLTAQSLGAVGPDLWAESLKTALPMDRTGGLPKFRLMPVLGKGLGQSSVLCSGLTKYRESPTTGRGSRWDHRDHVPDAGRIPVAKGSSPGIRIPGPGRQWDEPASTNCIRGAPIYGGTIGVS
jgi:hypothetical protein